jgi:hypothetical protein
MHTPPVLYDTPEVLVRLVEDRHVLEGVGGEEEEVGERAGGDAPDLAGHAEDLGWVCERWDGVGRGK